MLRRQKIESLEVFHSLGQEGKAFEEGLSLSESTERWDIQIEVFQC